MLDELEGLRIQNELEGEWWKGFGTAIIVAIIVVIVAWFIGLLYDS